MADYLREFPNFGELDVELPTGFEDISWRNDACPCFIHREARLVLYLDFADATLRECVGMRRFVAFAILPGDDIVADDLLVESDDIADVVRAVESRRK